MVASKRVEDAAEGKSLTSMKLLGKKLQRRRRYKTKGRWWGETQKNKRSGGLRGGGGGAVTRREAPRARQSGPQDTLRSEAARAGDATKKKERYGGVKTEGPGSSTFDRVKRLSRGCLEKRENWGKGGSLKNKRGSIWDPKKEMGCLSEASGIQ